MPAFLAGAASAFLLEKRPSSADAGLCENGTVLIFPAEKIQE
jgi:hypothetical protein